MVLRRGKKKEVKKEENQETHATYYVLKGVGSGAGCDYSSKVTELLEAHPGDEDRRTTKTMPSDVCGKALEALGLPEGISYFADTKTLWVSEEAKNKIESDPSINERFRKALGIKEKELNFRRAKT